MEDKSKKNKNKLHAVLAVENDIHGAATAIMKETKETFLKKHHLFEGSHRTLRMFDDERKNEEPAGEEHQKLESTVNEKLAYQQDYLVKWINVAMQKEGTNQTANADVIVDGKVLLSGLPATMLLNLESKLKSIRDVFLAIPTLQPGVKWDDDDQAGKENVYKAAKDHVSSKTEKNVRPICMAKATPQHKEQYEKVSEEKHIGEFVKQAWSGKMSPSDKSKLLARIDALSRAVKEARMAANNAEAISDGRVGETIFDFINGTK